MDSGMIEAIQTENIKALYESIHVDYSGMIEAVQAGNINALYKLIQGDPRVLEHIDEVPFIDTPLHLAASTDHLAFVQEIINLKPSFSRKLNQAGFSPMHLALQNDKIRMVRRLLKFDKDLVRVKGKEGMTPLHHAVQMGKFDILIKFLEVYPEAIEDVTVREETAFHIALRQDKFEAFKVLVGWLRRSCHKAAQSWENKLMTTGDFEGNTVLHVAVIQNKPSVVKLLLENFGHDQIYVENLERLTAVDIAEHKSKSDSREIYAMLRNADLIRFVIRKIPDSSVGRLIHSLFRKEPNSSRENIDSLRSKMSCYKKFKTAIARGRSDISENTRNMFLVVTVLIVTATYTVSTNPPKKEHKDDGVVTNASSPSSSAGSSIWGIDLIDAYSLFWMYNTLTFWAAVWLTAFLLPNRSFCLFLCITLALFGSCYMLLICATSLDISISSNYWKVFGVNNHLWYYSITIVNYICSTVFALLTAYWIARYVCLKHAKSRRLLLSFILLVTFLLITLSILFPAVLFSEVVWKVIRYKWFYYYYYGIYM